ncbi:F-box/FBD/LRR-repeat protein At4g00160 [Linum perenne]
MEKKNIIKNSTDRLSGLPDSVLHYILSFLDSKSIVRTSTLSKQWKYTWIQGSTLPLDSSTFRSEPSFETYIRKVLSRRSPSNLHKLSLTDYQDFKQDPEEDGHEDEEEDDDPLVVKLLEYAVSQETRHLVLNMSCELDYHAYKFPQSYRSISNCNLNTLQLLNFVIDDRFESFGFQLLTKLELNFSIYDSDQELRDPFSKFPCLKNLRIHSEGTSFAVSLRG